MNPKTEKIIKEIEKTKAKIKELQEKLAELEDKKTQLENEDFAAISRSYNLTPAQLAEFLKSGRMPTVQEDDHDT